MSKVHVVRADEYDLSLITPAVDEIFSQLGLDEKIKPDMRVVLKVNLLMKRRPDEATTTHPALAEGVINKLKSLGVRDIVIADSPGGPYLAQYLKGIYDASGMLYVAERTGAKVNLDTGFREVAAAGERVNSFNIINPLCDADFIINVPKLKTHGMTGMSGAVKNMFGSVPGLMKPELHMRFPDKRDFANMLIDLFLTVNPAVSITDAVVSMEGDGPSGGTPRKTGMIISSCDAFALDRVLSRVIGMENAKIEMLEEAERRGLFRGEEQIELVGDGLLTYPDFKKPATHSIDFMSYAGALKFLRKPLMRLVSPRPKIKRGACIGCGKCAESCPAKTIKVIDKKAHIDYSSCIKCFCCHEMCPVKAIEISRFRMFDL